MTPIIIGRKVYGICTRCRCWIRLNKLFFGSLHYCKEVP